MKTRNYLILFLLGILISFGVASQQTVPGYMDAEYYYAGAIRLFEGHGFTQPFLWNYLDEPTGIPHPSHTYWMPLASVVAAAGMGLAGSSDFFSAQSGFILLSAFLPVVTAWLAFQLTGKSESAMLAGLLALFPGFYLAYLTITENFALYMLLGALFMITAFTGNPERFSSRRFFLLGILAGFMHLTRADGLLWLAGALTLGVVGFIAQRRQDQVNPASRSLSKTAGMLVLVLVGYGLVMSPWFIRNLQAFGGLFPPGGSRALWLTDYNQTFRYPAETVTFTHWLSAGWSHHLSARWEALSTNLKSTLAVQGEIFLMPLVLAGLWRLRRLAIVRFGVGMWAVTLLVMTFVFPYAGWRGGFFHSGAALQPLWWAVAPVGLSAFVDWGVRQRNWNGSRSWRVFAASLVVFSVLLSAVLYYQRVFGGDLTHPAWRAGWDQHVRVAGGLAAFGVEPDAVMMVNNPPGFYAATRRSSIAMPDGGPETAVLAARRFGAAYFLLDGNHPDRLADLYWQPRNMDGLTYLGTVAETRLFRFQVGQ